MIMSVCLSLLYHLRLYSSIVAKMPLCVRVRLRLRGSSLLALGSWLLFLGSWLLALGSWLLARCSWLFALGWPNDLLCGFWCICCYARTLCVCVCLSCARQDLVICMRAPAETLWKVPLESFCLIRVRWFLGDAPPRGRYGIASILKITIANL